MNETRMEDKVAYKNTFYILPTMVSREGTKSDNKSGFKNIFSLPSVLSYPDQIATQGNVFILKEMTSGQIWNLIFLVEAVKK